MNSKFTDRFSTIFIDADDTLWENELYFRDAEAKFASLLAPHARVEDVQQLLWEKQEENIPLFGYGSKTYLIGMTDAAMELCHGSLPQETYLAIKSIIKSLAFHKLEVFPCVENTLKCLSLHHRLILATKGDAVEQKNKVAESGLEKYFHSVEVMKSKDEADYLELCKKYGIEPEDMVMVGNSVRSDIIPVINIGGTAILIPHEIVWVHELADTPDSERLIEISDFSALTTLFVA